MSGVGGRRKRPSLDGEAQKGSAFGSPALPFSASSLHLADALAIVDGPSPLYNTLLLASEAFSTTSSRRAALTYV